MARVIGVQADGPRRPRPLGKVVSSLRLQRGLTRRQLVDRVRNDIGERGMSAQYLSDIESGRRTSISASLLTALARALDVDLNYLFFLAGKLSPDLQEVAIDQQSLQRAIEGFRAESIRGLIRRVCAERSDVPDFSDSPTAFKALLSGCLYVEPGTYLSDITHAVEGSGSVSAPFKPAWQMALLRDIRRDLRLVAAQLRNNATVSIRFLTPQSQDSRRLQGRLNDEHIASLEIVFDIPSWRQLIRIDPLGTADWFSLVYFRGQMADKLLNLRGVESKDIEVLRALEDHRIPVCAPPGQAVDALLESAVFVGRLPSKQSVEDSRISSLIQWLRGTRVGILACDVGVARQVMISAAALGIEDLLASTKVPYPVPPKVGFASGRDDGAWHDYFHAKRLNILRRPDPEIQQSWRATRDRLNGLGISYEPSAGESLRRQEISEAS